MNLPIMNKCSAYLQNKEADKKETNASKSVMPKSEQKSDFSENTQSEVDLYFRDDVSQSHWTMNCKIKNQKSNVNSKITNVDATVGTDSSHIEQKQQSLVDSGNSCIDTFATSVDSLLVTNDPMYMRLNLEGVGTR